MSSKTYEAVLNPKNVVKICDESYGFGYFTRGRLSDGAPFLLYSNFGLKEDYDNVIKMFLQKHTAVKVYLDSRFNVAENIAVKTDNNAKLVESIKNVLKRTGFKNSPLGKKTIEESRLEDSFVFPTNKFVQVTTQLEEHFKRKAELINIAFNENLTFNRKRVLQSTQRNTPFFILSGIPKGDIHEMRFRNMLKDVLKECVVVKAYLEENFFEIGFYPTTKFLNEVRKYLLPSFPMDSLHKVQEVRLETSKAIPSDLRYVFARNKILESGAALSCVKLSPKAIKVTIPYNPNLGGVFGPAYDQRLSYITKVIQESTDTQGEYSHGLLSSYDYSDVKPYKSPRVTRVEENINFSYLQPICEALSSELPELEDLLFEGKINSFLCETGNYLVTKRRGKKIHIYQGVKAGFQATNVREYIPHLYRLGKGILA